MNDLEQRLETIEGYRTLLLASTEQDDYGDFDYLEKQIESFEEDRGERNTHHQSKDGR